MIVGAHVSIQGGVQNAPAHGNKLGCEAIQMFTKNQRQWEGKPYADEDIKAFRQAMKQAGIKASMAHATYLINLANPTKETKSRSVKALTDEANRCNQLGIPSLIFHPGAHLDAGINVGVQRIADAMLEVLDRIDPGPVSLVLETMAGQGTTIGHRFEQLRDILDLVGDGKRTGVCLDTCHVFAAGYDLSTEEGYEETWRRFDDAVGLKALRAIHLNDSQFPLDGRKDRHANIGSGHITTSGFSYLVNDARLDAIPACLETPGGDEEWLKDLRTLRSLKGKRVANARRTLASFDSNGGARTKAPSKKTGGKRVARKSPGFRSG